MVTECGHFFQILEWSGLPVGPNFCSLLCGNSNLAMFNWTRGQLAHGHVLLACPVAKMGP